MATGDSGLADLADWYLGPEEMGLENKRWKSVTKDREEDREVDLKESVEAPLVIM